LINEKEKDALLNSLKNPIIFCDTHHIIRYMNKSAVTHYSEGQTLLGTNVLQCHNADSRKMMLEIFAEMQNGLEERLITDNAKYRIYMRAIRDEDGTLIGYYERYEPPVKSS
jgi:DUF438 domain-containing protein